MKVKFLTLLCALAVGSGTFADAAGGDPAVTQVQTLTSSLLKSMREGRTESTTQRIRQLEPVIEEVFALPLMTRLSVGPDWNTFSLQQQRAVLAAFSRYTIANYAHNFRDFSGQSFAVDPNVVTRGDDRVVQTSLTSPGSAPANLLYRMRAIDGKWKVIDVYFNGVSQLTLRRVQFASAIGSGGAPALIAYLNKVSNGLMK